MDQTDGGRSEVSERIELKFKEQKRRWVGALLAKGGGKKGKKQDFMGNR